MTNLLIIQIKSLHKYIFCLIKILKKYNKEYIYVYEFYITYYIRVIS